MRRLMDLVRRQAQATFSQVPHTGEVFERNLSKLRSVVSRITAEEVCLDLSLLEKPVQDPKNDTNPAPVTYVEILEDPDFTINMFVVREGNSIPLHDHPMMHGILKVVHGRVKIKSYSCADSSQLSNFFHRVTISVKKEEEMILGSEDEAIVLRPVNGNIHEINSFEGPAAFVDLLAPPYHTVSNGNPRHCHYYMESGLDQNGDVILKQTGLSRSYWTDWAPYLGPPLQ